MNFPPERIHFHGNNKSEQELAEALDYGIARIIVDNLHEMHLLNGTARRRAGMRQRMLLRVSPGVDPHTHRLTTTGTTDNKFGISIVTGQAEHAVRQALDTPGLELVGMHVAPGLADLRDGAVSREAVDVVFDFAAKMRKAYGFELQEFSPGGGFAVNYTEEQDAPSPDEYAEIICSHVIGRLREARPRRAAHVHRAGPLDRRARRRRAVHGRLVEGHPGRAALRLRGRRHGGQHPPGALRIEVRGDRREQAAGCAHGDA